MEDEKATLANFATFIAKTFFKTIDEFI